jgi:hypothetical protein
MVNLNINVKIPASVILKKKQVLAIQAGEA